MSSSRECRSVNQLLSWVPSVQGKHTTQDPIILNRVGARPRESAFALWLKGEAQLPYMCSYLGCAQALA